MAQDLYARRLNAATAFFRQAESMLEPSYKEKLDMSWDNHGDWHIDHIIPLKYDNPTLEQTIQRLHYTNTQPLWATENISKGNRYVG